MRAILLITGWLVCQISLAQPRIEEKVRQLQQHQAEHFHEKIYAHLNRTDLIVGEVLWFKLYTVDAMLHELTGLSKVAYVELLNASNQSVLQAKVQLDNGMGHGSFYLPATLPSGAYLFRAYTNWMKNQSASFFFQRPITLLNTLKAIDVAAPTNADKLHLELMPEGGHWVEGLPGRTAFKLSNNGLGVSGKVLIINENQDTLATATTLKNGIGQFMFTPKAGETYQAVATTERFASVKQNIFPIEPSGYSLIVSDSVDQIKVEVFSSQPMPVSMVVHTRQSVKVVQTSASLNGKTKFVFAKNKLAAGISNITIFDWDNKPICERLIFKKPSSSTLTVQPSQNAYNTRRKISIALSSSQTQGNYSISVYRADSLNSATNIETHLLLTSDLIGHVETPEFYFSDDAQAALAADNLMLTHGWRRFVWKDLDNQAKTKPEYLPEVRGHLIQGKLIDSFGNPVSQKNGFLTNPGKKVRLYAARSDMNGNIRFQMKEYRGEGKIIAQADFLTDSLVRIKIEDPFSTSVGNTILSSTRLAQSFERPLVARSIGMQVQDIFREDETYFSYESIQNDTVPFYGIPDERYRLDDYTRFPAMEDVLREYVKGVWVSKNRNNFRFRVPDKLNGGLFKENPLVLVDGVPVFDINQVMEIDPLKIKTIDIVARKYFIGPVDLSGIVSFSSYSGDMASATIDPRSVALNYEGLQQARQFYSPQYTTQTSRSSRLPDQRYQLYWNPRIALEQNKANTIEFYSSDVEGKFLVVLEGISAQGSPATVVKTFSVSQ